MLTRTYTISCDGPDCSTDPIVVERGISDPPDGPGAVMAAARLAGWHRFKRDKHACPEHTAWMNDQVGPEGMIDPVAVEVARGYRGVQIDMPESGTRLDAEEERQGALARARARQREAQS